jgi:hypothetical protein
MPVSTVQLYTLQIIVGSGCGGDLNLSLFVSCHRF